MGVERYEADCRAVDVAKLCERAGGRYFADFSGAAGFPQQFALAARGDLSDAIDQLTLMADVRQSPLVALMNTLSVQGRTGQTGKLSPIRWSNRRAAVQP
ncbi:hypothetical protein J4733_10715 [Klebsiella pneumoniae]|uniref:Uncharacterized protein n=1 Tax=Klebsiella pneumoniae TaxID=573 RepID=A0A939NQ87_KLEPN|nr:hypothetical protein [Klebsiella pneumoniae]